MLTVESCKEFIDHGRRQVKLQTELIKLKLKMYGVQKKIDADFVTLGDEVYKCFENGKLKTIKEEKVGVCIDTIREQKKEIENTQQEIDAIREEIDTTSKHLKERGSDIITDIKESVSSIGKPDTPERDCTCKDRSSEGDREEEGSLEEKKDSDIKTKKGEENNC